MHTSNIQGDRGIGGTRELRGRETEGQQRGASIYGGKGGKRIEGKEARGKGIDGAEGQGNKGVRAAKVQIRTDRK